ncbi:hypothetical protein EVJ58_g62 [Rhodofomes roseus]|uniref:Uncharacterized protein n=1 Tax=Rhodofomes roseus TaxID=34475 RepID=A0A4Y9Z5W0_9APHY|nr:hypothetical protein EVJ58_g62 [Rhodofomes roseus]
MCASLRSRTRLHSSHTVIFATGIATTTATSVLPSCVIRNTSAACPANYRSNCMAAYSNTWETNHGDEAFGCVAWSSLKIRFANSNCERVSLRRRRFPLPGPTLRKLWLDGITFKSEDDLLHLLAAFPKLSDVRLEGMEITQDISAIGDEAYRTRIESLHVDCYDYVPSFMQFVRRLLSPPIKLRLRRISWDLDTKLNPGYPHAVSDVAVLLDSIRVSSDVLEACEINFDHANWLHHLNTSSLTRLASLTLGLSTCDIDHPVYPNKFDYLPEFLTTLYALHLRRLQLLFSLMTFEPRSSLLNFPWPQLDNALISLHKRYPTLKLSLRVQVMLRP